MSDSEATRPVLVLTAQIVSAQVANNAVPTEDLPALIQQIYRALTTAGSEPSAAPERPHPAVPVKRSVFPDHIVCLEDGKKFKMLKRHLQTAHHLTLAQYRERWGLSSDYPLVAPNYADHRSALAKQIGLGRKRMEAGAVAAKRGRKSPRARSERGPI